MELWQRIGSERGMWGERGERRELNRTEWIVWGARRNRSLEDRLGITVFIFYPGCPWAGL